MNVGEAGGRRFAQALVERPATDVGDWGYQVDARLGGGTSTYQIYGQISAGLNVAPGTYADAVKVTIAY